MAKGDYLGDVELLILTAVMLLGENAYGMTVHEKVEELAEGQRDVSLGSVYVTLERLENKGFVKSWFADPTKERGGRAKKCFEITGSGATAVKNSLRVANKMLREIGGVA